MADSNSSFHILDSPPEASSSAAVLSPDSETLEQRHDRLTKERETLLKRIEVRKLEDEVRKLRRQADGVPPNDGSVVDPKEEASVASKRQRPGGDREDDAPSAKHSRVGGDMRIVKPDLYNSKSARAFREYVRQCEITFRLGADRYTKDSTKVLYAAQFLVGDTAGAFELLEKTNGPDTTSWEDYKTFLRNLLQDPVTRATTLARRYNEAKQRQGQTVAQFVNYLDELEAEMPPYSDEQRRQHLLAKLSPELSRALHSYQSIPATRIGLIEYATQLEANLNRNPRADRRPSTTRREPQRESNPGGRGKPRGPTQHRDSDSSSAPPTAEPGPPRQKSKLSREERKHRTKGNLCFACGGEGHYASQCLE